MLLSFTHFIENQSKPEKDKTVPPIIPSFTNETFFADRSQYRAPPLLESAPLLQLPWVLCNRRTPGQKVSVNFLSTSELFLTLLSYT